MTSLTTYGTFTGTGGPRNVSGYIPAKTTTVNTYEELITISTLGLELKRFILTAATNDLTFLLESSVDKSGALYFEAGEFTILAGDAHVIVMEGGSAITRISVKPAVAGSHGTAGGGFSGATLSTKTRVTQDYESITVTNAAAIGFTRDTMGSAIEAVATVEDNPIRYRCDGVAPTTTEGHLLQPGDALQLDSTIDALNFLAIATAANAKIKVSYAR